MMVDENNQNIQVTLDVLGTLFYLMGFLKTQGMTNNMRKNIQDFTNQMKQHVLQKVWNIFSGKTSDPSFPIKQEYIHEALKRIGSSAFEGWQLKADLLKKAFEHIAKLGVSIATMNVMDGIGTIGRIVVDIIHYKSAQIASSWFDTANNALALASESIDTIKKRLFYKEVGGTDKDHLIMVKKDKNITFYVITLLLDIA